MARSLPRRLGPRDHVTRDTDRRGCDSSGGVPDVPGGEVTGEALQHPQRHCTVDHVARAVPPLTSTLKCSRPIKGRDGFKLPPNHLLIFFRAWLAACLGAASYRHTEPRLFARIRRIHRGAPRPHVNAFCWSSSSRSTCLHTPFSSAIRCKLPKDLPPLHVPTSSSVGAPLNAQTLHHHDSLITIH